MVAHSGLAAHLVRTHYPAGMSRDGANHSAMRRLWIPSVGLAILGVFMIGYAAWAMRGLAWDHATGTASACDSSTSSGGHGGTITTTTCTVTWRAHGVLHAARISTPPSTYDGDDVDLGVNGDEAVANPSPWVPAGLVCCGAVIIALAAGMAYLARLRPPGDT